MLDVDPRHGGAVDARWPATRAVQTRSGGTHLWLCCPDAVRCSVGKLGVGLDVRGEGGYVLVPPTPGYRWLNELPLAVVAASFFAADQGSSRRRRRGRRDRRAGQGRFSPRESVDDGERNSYLAQTAGWLWDRGLEADELEQALLAHNARVCRPPLDDEEVERIAASIARYPR